MSNFIVHKVGVDVALFVEAYSPRCTCTSASTIENLRSRLKCYLWVLKASIVSCTDSSLLLLILLCSGVNADGLHLERQIEFSARHWAYKLAPPGGLDNNIEASYILFGYGVEKDLPSTSGFLERFALTTVDDVY